MSSRSRCAALAAWTAAAHCASAVRTWRNAAAAFVCSACCSAFRSRVNASISARASSTSWASAPVINGNVADSGARSPSRT